MFHRRTPAFSSIVIRVTYALALLGSLMVGVMGGFWVTQEFLGAPPGPGVSPRSPFYVQSWVHWVVSCALMSCLLALPCMAASMKMACSIARSHTPLDGACYSWLGDLDAGLEYDPVSRRHRYRAFLEDLNAYAASSQEAFQEVQQFKGGGKNFQNRDAAWLVARMESAGLHSRFQALSPSAGRALR